jgi:hypothetical protein
MRTTSPTPVYRSTRDTRNAPLWNPRTKELLNVEEDEAGKLASFRARFGGGFDVLREEEQEEGGKEGKGKVEVKGEGRKEVKGEEQKRRELEDDEGWDFGEDDANMLDLISRFGQEEDIRQKDAVVKKNK